MVKNFTKLMKDNPDTNSESSMNPNKRSKKKLHRHNIAKLLKLKDKEKIFQEVRGKVTLKGAILRMTAYFNYNKKDT